MQLSQLDTTSSVCSQAGDNVCAVYIWVTRCTSFRLRLGLFVYAVMVYAFDDLLCVGVSLFGIIVVI